MGRNQPLKSVPRPSEIATANHGKHTSTAGQQQQLLRAMTQSPDKRNLGATGAATVHYQRDLHNEMKRRGTENWELDRSAIMAGHAKGIIKTNNTSLVSELTSPVDIEKLNQPQTREPS